MMLAGPPGLFSHVTLPHASALDRIRSGDGRLIDFVNPEALKGLDDPNASGGTRPAGNLAWQANAERLQAELRQDLHFLLGKRQVQANPRADAVRVFIVAGLFGGFGTGAWAPLRSTLWALSDEFGVRLDLMPFFVVPGVHSGKDRVNSRAVAYAVIKELVADASDCRWFRDSSRGLECAGNERVRSRDALFISDSNNAPCPKLLPPPNLNALGSEVLEALIFTPVGDLIETQLGDFSKAGARLTPNGESCHGRTIGLSEIRLNRERLYRYSSSVAKLDFLDRAAREGPEEVIRQEAVAWIESLRLGFAPVPQGAAGELMRRARSSRILERFRSLFRGACEKLGAREVVRTGRSLRDLALTNSGNFEGAVEDQIRPVAEEAEANLKALVVRMACDSARGPAYAGHWVRICGGCIDAVLEMYRQESALLHEKTRKRMQARNQSRKNC